MSMYIWTNSGGDNKWSNADNWSPNGVPGTNPTPQGDMVRFVDLKNVNATTVVLDQEIYVPLYVVHFESSTTKYTISGTNTLLINYELGNLGTSTNTISCPLSFFSYLSTLINSGQINLSGPITATNPGKINLSTGTLNISGAAVGFCDNIVIRSPSSILNGCQSN